METVTRNWSDISRKVLGGVVGAIVAGTATVSGMDQFILWIWNGVFGLAGTGAEMPAAVAAVIGTVLGAFVGGYLPREKLAADAKVTPSSGSTLRSPPVATGIAFALALLFLSGALAGCTAAAGNRLSGQIATARQYVMLAEQTADTCVALRLPICQSPAVIDGIAKAKVVADEALDQAQQYADAGSDQERVQALLRVAMNAVLMLYALKG